MTTNEISWSYDEEAWDGSCGDDWERNKKDGVPRAAGRYV